jgi:hypothetical protein
VTVLTLPSLDLITGAKAQSLLRAAQAARLPGDFADLVDQIGAELAIEWKPFGGGGGRVPHSALGAAEDPALLLAEPVMNSFDAHFEQAMRIAALGGDPPPQPSSPREAAHIFFGVPAEGLAAWDARRGEARKTHDQLARMTQVVLRNGTEKATPTIAFIDEAIGQHPCEFWSTVLSLQLGNKAEIPYTAGQYGHGAGMLLGFSSGGQVMISRRCPKLLDEDQDDLVGLVLIRKRMPSETGKPNPHYECLVSKRTGEPVAFDPSALANPQWHGLQRICIDYELASGSFQFIYDTFDHFLPHPPMPYELRDERAA